jgi:hypothetical protein
MVKVVNKVPFETESKWRVIERCVAVCMSCPVGYSRLSIDRVVEPYNTSAYTVRRRSEVTSSTIGEHMSLGKRD